MCLVDKVNLAASYRASLIISVSLPLECCPQYLDAKILEKQHPENCVQSSKYWGLLLVLKDSALFPPMLHP